MEHSTILSVKCRGTSHFYSWNCVTIYERCMHSYMCNHALALPQVILRGFELDFVHVCSFNWLLCWHVDLNPSIKVDILGQYLKVNFKKDEDHYKLPKTCQNGESWENWTVTRLIGFKDNGKVQKNIPDEWIKSALILCHFGWCLVGICFS